MWKLATDVSFTISPNQVNSDTRDNIGEKTLLFGSDDIFMDMTQSHSVHLAIDGEFLPDISVQNNELTSREKTQIFSGDDGSMDMTFSHTSRMANVPEFPTSLESHVENKNASSSVSCLDPDFENFLSSLFKPNGSSANPEDDRATTSAGTFSEDTNTSLLQVKAPRSHVDKENLPPALQKEKSCSASRKRGPSRGPPAGDEPMDMTQSHTVTVSGGLPTSPTHSQIHGKKGHISTQEEKQMEALCMYSLQCTDFSFKPATASVSTTTLPDSCVLGSSSDPARTNTSSVSFLSKRDGQTFHVSSSSGEGVWQEDDVTMDMTEAPTRFITGWKDDQVFLPSQNQKQGNQEISEKASSTADSAGTKPFKIKILILFVNDEH